MENIIFIEEIDRLTGEKLEAVTIDHGNGQYTSMPKWKWDEIKAAEENNV